MKVKNIAIGATVTVLLLLWLVTLGPVGATVVKIDLSPQNVSAGEGFRVDVTIEDVTDMAADGAILHFDPNAMQATGITAGVISTFPLANIDNTAGTVTFAYALMTGSFTGSGPLATVDFTADASAEGTFDLVLTDVELLRPDLSEIPANVFDGTITIGGPEPIPTPTPTPTPTPRPYVGGGGGGPPAPTPVVTTLHTDATGKVTSSVTATSSDKKACATIPAGTIAKDAAGNPLTEVKVTPPPSLPAMLPPDVEYKGYAYDFRPDGATFSEPIEISITFDPADFRGTTPVIYTYEGGWKRRDTTVVDNTATTQVGHFSTFVLFAEKVALAPSPAPTSTPTLTPSPASIPTPTPIPTLAPVPGLPSLFLILIVTAVIVITAVIIVVRRRKK